MNAIRRILVPIDFSEASRAAFDYAIELARSVGASVDVLHVWEVPTFLAPGSAVVVGASGTSLVEMVRTAAEDGLEKFVTDAAARGAKVNEWRAEPGSPAFAITEAARTAEYDLIVIGTHGRTGLSRALIGSVAERVVRHAPCPVLTVRSVQKG
jgi:nucleotide-binding universal stress UspA family protein